MGLPLFPLNNDPRSGMGALAYLYSPGTMIQGVVLEHGPPFIPREQRSQGVVWEHGPPFIPLEQ